ncbi:hypothetical protein TcWFU_001567 [Taenia crassiceps]|uniref:Histone RNA hairpin-binding protein RNA-binding domain-containing protein n=1 Tax=Taenia crassiceps TaxID=6207 RepID=A0ABR4QG31_9CEST
MLQLYKIKIQSLYVCVCQVLLRVRRMSKGDFSRRSRKSAPARKAMPSDAFQRDRSVLRGRTGKASVSTSHSVLLGLRSLLECQHLCVEISERKRCHEYDPYLEIRKARERLSLYKSKGDFPPDEFLSMDSDRDLQRYEEKLRRRYSEQGDFTGEIELERRQSELLRRQRDIDVGKTTEKYAEYVLKIPKPEREKHHPRTPNKFRVVSRRGWDGMIRKWRKDIHNYENLNSDETWHSLASDVSVSSNSRSPSPGYRAEERLERAAGPDERGGKGTKRSASKERRQPGELEAADEDTLQAGKKMAQSAALGSDLADGETLNDDDVKWNLRGRKVPTSKSGNSPSPDVIHSGLTNDLTALGVKRDDLTFEDISAMLSPKKRARASRSRSAGRPYRALGRKRGLDKRS